MALTFDSLGYSGRLGNQLFQYAALRGISSNLGYDYLYPSDNIELCKIFNIPPKVGTGNANRLSPSGFEFDENLYSSCPDGTDLYGYFQSEKYFKNVETILRNEFKFSNQIEEYCTHYIKSRFQDDEVISLHVRRGDYLKEKNFVNLSLNYYYESLNYLPKKSVLVFSDDSEWCKKNFFDERFTIVESNNQKIDLCLMALCDYHIIANSSFSWWGSWLSKSKKTISPSQWFQNDYSHWNTKDLYLPDWIVI
jgi:hypothetical protein